MKHKIVALGAISVVALAGLFFFGDLGTKRSDQEGGGTFTNIDAAKVSEDYRKLKSMLDTIYDYEVPYPEPYSMKDKQMAVFMADTDEALLWNHDGKGNSKIIKKSELPQEKTFSFFSDGEFNGRKTIYVMHEGNVDATFVLGIHEGYHFYGQDYLMKLNNATYRPRGTFYPENVEYGYLTRESFTRLYEHMDGKNADGAKEALYFFNELQKKQPEALNGDLDTGVTEGTATLVESLYLAVARDPELKNDFTKLSKAAFDIAFKGGFEEQLYDKGFEYYKISALPYFYLGTRGEAEKITKLFDVTYPYALLGLVTEAKAAGANESLKQQAERFYRAVNAKSKAIIDEAVGKTAAAGYVKILVPDDTFEGSGEFGEFINYEENGRFKTVNANMSQQTANGKIRFINANVLSSDPSAQPFFEYSVRTEEVKITGNTLSIDTKNLKASDVAFEKTEGGYTLINR